ncbi:isochorismatase family protein [Deinococcus taeanensis]|uniref:isochorismatase family protein n=1 Tax=Deinococcus taeanensis TaxID=2737050 RepID=UPI001CDBE64A|nr:isochorismatase family protein [Deinococcus taeanensis]UBV42661.1 isochorismatase family protein [Deinococcus taeanensis]
MSLTPNALLLLNAQRHDLDDRPDGRVLARDWAHHVAEARSRGWLVTFVQWDAPHGAAWVTFSRDWTLHPDFRAEQGDVLVRAALPDAFEGSELSAQLHARAVQTLHVLALPGTPAAEATLHSARKQGFEVAPLEVPA